VILVDRLALTLRSPEAYHVPLVLQAQRQAHVSARRDGVVFQVYTKLEQKVASQEELLRLDQQQLQLELDQANALLRAAQLSEGDTPNKEAGAARTAAAKAAADLAKLHLDDTQLRAPFNGMVTRIHVQVGEYVAAGTPVATVVDPTVLTAVIPLERDQVKRGETLAVQIEGRKANATMEAVLAPPPAEFEPLRDLFSSLVAVQVVLNNPTGEWQVGQTIISDMIPRHPIAEVPNQAILNVGDGERKVQVLREGFVRDLPVQILGNVGDTHVFVSARFQSQDELIASSSERLSDGTWLRPRLHVSADGTAPAPNAPGQSTKPAPTPGRGGF
jgi:multidrug efflux pump subunit AcrA (membrane-fusion protein)